MIQIGRFGTGVLNIENGALVRTSDDLLIANGAGSQGTVNIGGEMLGQPAELDVAVIVDVGAVGPGEINLAAGGRLTASRLNVRPNATVNMTGGELILNQLDTGGAGGGGAFNMTGGRLHVANVFGDLVHSGGVVAPGASPGTTDVTGNYDQSAGGASRSNWAD